MRYIVCQITIGTVEKNKRWKGHWECWEVLEESAGQTKKGTTEQRHEGTIYTNSSLREEYSCSKVKVSSVSIREVCFMCSGNREEASVTEWSEPKGKY